MFKTTPARFCLAFAIHLLLPVYLYCQSRPFINYTADDGLPQTEIISILQDSRGYIWLGTWEGVSRFDGHTFTNFSTGDGLIHGSVQALLEDSRGAFWFGTVKGVSRFDGKNWRSFTSKDGLAADFVWTILEDRQGRFWFGTQNGLSRLDSGAWQSFTTNDGLAGNIVYSLLEDSRGALWAGTLNGLSRLHGGKWESFTVEDGLADNAVRSILEMPNGKIWFGTQNGISVFDGQAWEKIGVADGLGDKHVVALARDREGNVWCATRKGVSMFAGGRWTVFTTDNGLANDNVLKLLEDSEGNLWFGTVGGASRLNGLAFLKYTREDGLVSNSLLSAYEDSRGNLWFGTEGGVSRFDGKNWRSFRLEDGLPELLVCGIVEDDSHNLWFGTYGGGVCRYDGKNWWTFNRAGGFTGDFVNVALKDSRGKLWFGTHSGVGRFDGKEWRSFNTESGLAHSSVYAILEDKSGRMWFGTYGGGVSRLDGESWQTFTAADGLGSDFVLCIFQDKAGRLWFGTEAGVVTWDGASFQRFGPADGLPSGACFSILERENMLYFGTSRGILRYDGTGSRQYTVEDGLASNQTIRNAVIQDRRGKLWIGTVNGVSCYDPDLDHPRLVPPPIYITGVSTLDNRPLADHCRLKYSEKHLRFNFSGIWHGAPESVSYSYQLEGSSPDWHTSTLQTVQYTHLPPGNYTFRVKAGNKYGLWSPQPAEFSFTITPPFWNTWWFILFFVAGLCGLLYFIIEEGRKLKESKALREKNLELNKALDFLKKEIFERRQAEEALRKGKERLRFAVNNLPAIIWTVDCGLRFTLSEGIGLKNLGLETGEVVGMSLFEFFKIDDPEYKPIAMHRRALNGESVFYELPYDNLTYVVHLDPLRDERGAINGVYGIALDITESKQLEVERSRADRLESIGLLAGGIAHDFNNILTAILGNISLLKVLLPGDRKLSEILTEAENASLRARSLTQQLITFSRSSMPVRKFCRLPKLLEEWSTFSLRGTNVKCSYRIAEDLWSVNVDESQISQVVNNLVINASQAMPEGGEITIRAENYSVAPGSHPPLTQGKYVKIRVEDQGIGIPEEHLSRIFDPYFTTKQKGSGLGLTTSYAIIKKHEGYMEVESRPGGSVFSIYLPAAAGDLPGDVSSGDGTPINGRKILFMDDEAAVREVAVLILNKLGYEVVSSVEGHQTVELYRKAAGEGKPFDAVILDLTIAGGLGGREAMQKILEFDPRAKGIVSSGYSNDRTLADYEQFGFRGLVEKPYSMEELRQVLDRVLGK